MSSLSISVAWDETRAILVRDGRLYLSVALALVVLPQVVMAVVGSPVASDASMLARIVYIAAVLLGIIAQIAMCRLAIGPAVMVGDAIVQGLSRLISVFVVFICGIVLLAIVAALVSIALGAFGVVIVKTPGVPSPAMIVLLLFLGAFEIAILQLVVPLAAAETGNPLRLASRSWQMARGHYLRLLGFVAAVLFGLGLIVIAVELGLGSATVLVLGQPEPGSMSALILGLIGGVLQAGFTIVTAVMLARIYLQLAGGGRAQPGVPNSGI
jgi:hypothetical protein